ncbi:MAG: AAC(3) family N-acetyltransferase [Candidatus Thorarchaeota archaeon]|nr:AAC(3) family N-acetyltransferase [Candidatus Thorarchaeota archaeon]
MSHWEKEKLVVENTPEPITKSRLVKDLRRIGVLPGDTISVHISMSRLGWIVGHEVTVIEALKEAVTEEGTLVMQAHSTGNTDPRNWNYPPVPESWWETIRSETPPYHPEITPLRGLGRVPALFRTMPDVYRSNHPHVSCTAWGKNARQIVVEHDLEDSYGDRTPWGALYRLDSKILLFGVDYESNTAFHHAEIKTSTPNTPTVTTGAAILENGERKWVSWDEIEYNSDDFNDLGEAFEKSIGYEPMLVGQAESRLLPMKDIIDFAVEWFQENR